MNKSLSKVLAHYRFKHETEQAFKCGHCDFDSNESAAVRSHCSLEHDDKPLMIVDAVSGKQYEGDEAMDELAATPRADPNAGRPDDLESLAAPYVKRIGDDHFCKLCPYKQRFFATVKRHVCSVHLKYYPFKCKYCTFTSIERNKTILHIKGEHPQESIKIIRLRFQGILPDIPGEEGPIADNDSIRSSPLLDFPPSSKPLCLTPPSTARCLHRPSCTVFPRLGTGIITLEGSTSV